MATVTMNYQQIDIQVALSLGWEERTFSEGDSTLTYYCPPSVRRAYGDEDWGEFEMRWWESGNRGVPQFTTDAHDLQILIRAMAIRSFSWNVATHQGKTVCTVGQRVVEYFNTPPNVCLCLTWLSCLCPADGTKKPSYPEVTV